MRKTRLKNVKQGELFTFYPNASVMFERYQDKTSYAVCRRHGSKEVAVTSNDIVFKNYETTVYIYD